MERFLGIEPAPKLSLARGVAVRGVNRLSQLQKGGVNSDRCKPHCEKDNHEINWFNS